MLKIYSGIGSRETPEVILETMYGIGRYLAAKGWTLRSGDAPGADTEFEKGSDAGGGRKEIYLADDRLEPWWVEFAELYHPAWHRCSEIAKRLHARNTPIVLGPESPVHSGYEPSDLVVCWTKDGKATGGTGQGIRIATAYGIPVFNLYHADAKQDLWAWLRANP